MGCLLLGAVLGSGLYWIYGGGRHEGPGTVTRAPVPPSEITARVQRQKEFLSDIEAGSERPGEAEATANAGTGNAKETGSPGETAAVKQILFGDLHVHTTFSADAFMRSLPLMAGEGAHPPADACDFARYCSSLDFFSLNDHAEALTPSHWKETKESLRQCNAVAGDPKNPDLVAFAGWEWSQVGPTPETHYGHKNVIFPDLDDDQLPTRPIAAPGMEKALSQVRSVGLLRALALPITDFSNRDRYLDLVVFSWERSRLDLCPEGVDIRKLPDDCYEVAATPRALFEKLDQWGFDSIVIPHGTTWGFYSPPGTSYRKQISPALHDPARQRLFEIYSGHGNSEEYRSFQAVVAGPDGAPVCPEPTAEFEPCCWRAGEIIRARCGDAPTKECHRRVAEARQNYVDAGVAGHLTVPGATVDDWKNCGQCQDCFNPAFNYRSGGSAQLAVAAGYFGDSGKKPAHATFGFIASSDNHTARPGTGYKEMARRKMTEATGAIDEIWRRRLFLHSDVAPESVRLVQEKVLSLPPFQIVDVERQASFFMTGGLVAVHSEGRHREAIWKALKRREVYGTSGERILLWFDLVNGADGPRPMGSEVEMSDTPLFRIRAAGALEQKKGCPDWSRNALGPARLQRLCLDECYNPGDQRHKMDRIDVIRIRRQLREDESIESLIDDPWKSFQCTDTGFCQGEFDDPEFAKGGRDTLYYIRAVQEPTLAVNAGGLRCVEDEQGRCSEVRPCYGDYRTDDKDDCLGENQERAWSSPIYLAFAEPAKSGASSELEAPGTGGVP